MHRKKLAKKIRLPKIQELISVASERVDGVQKTKDWTRRWRRLAGRFYGIVIWELVKLGKYEKNVKILNWKEFLNFSSWLRAVVSGSLEHPNQKHVFSLQIKKIPEVESESYMHQKEILERIKTQFLIIQEAWSRVFDVVLVKNSDVEDWSVDCNHVIFISFTLKDPATVPPSSSAPPPPPSPSLPPVLQTF